MRLPQPTAFRGGGRLLRTAMDYVVQIGQKEGCLLIGSSGRSALGRFPPTIISTIDVSEGIASIQNIYNS